MVPLEEPAGFQDSAVRYLCIILSEKFQTNAYSQIFLLKGNKCAKPLCLMHVACGFPWPSNREPVANNQPLPV